MPGKAPANLPARLGNKGRFAKDSDFRSQICRSAVSVMSNIAEGFESQTPGTFIRYLNIAKGSAGELRSQLCIARDIEYISNTNFYSLCKQCRKISSQIAKLIQYLKKRQT